MSQIRYRRLVKKMKVRVMRKPEKIPSTSPDGMITFVELPDQEIMEHKIKDHPKAYDLFLRYTRDIQEKNIVYAR